MHIHKYIWLVQLEIKGPYALLIILIDSDTSKTFIPKHYQAYLKWKNGFLDNGQKKPSCMCYPHFKWSHLVHKLFQENYKIIIWVFLHQSAGKWPLQSTPIQLLLLHSPTCTLECTTQRLMYEYEYIESR